MRAAEELCGTPGFKRCPFGQLSKNVSTALVRGEVTHTAFSSFASLSSLALRFMACRALAQHHMEGTRRSLETNHLLCMQGPFCLDCFKH